MKHKLHLNRKSSQAILNLERNNSLIEQAIFQIGNVPPIRKLVAQNLRPNNRPTN